MEMDPNQKRHLSSLITMNHDRSLGTMLRVLLPFLVFLLVASGASAATLNVVGGQLLGASGVIVDGSSYDVTFLDGT